MVKKTHPEIRQVKQITPTHIAEFISTKTENCSQKTLDNFVSSFKKLSLVVNAAYHINTNYTKDLVVPQSHKNGGGKIRFQFLETDDYNTLLKTTNTNLARM